ncbi:cytochrome c oxidase subunit 7C, mitochondrial [Neodiprion pinetum]|uniref:Cytochrome c oxidase subunit 7C, mitochondrial n=1 Tax=Neodiprion lecontei TaxID=441921 RepID=A0A6J0B3J3_NEOLC|nr:cytochrome c oxidase subunit 7C, mitochondrial [Neodiprion lecontei]XP_046420147.1 cytochrome c oxidase subunit 7C, mitochondrial-like [Neodiprion fabricii]XP_046420148.1 cytochrome c oxidase subunit 7C, mitochondrial-like [Neodiprion fabricii]XP_046480109.1 cytochrome c oxidase subunit 7C, mitochondrial-like [Neodiprion pinetum]XP_046480110.1 cytochrome c oxidase subunit 7C, mitochondrial-like [Neodiprion pinetum]XP_046594816.1 cytochrome c oxidase subunit 7C, mitochondrial [Neodiprion lec
MLSRQIVRNFMTTVARRSGADDFHGGVPGGNLPFGINNRYKLTAYFIFFFGTGLGVPYLLVRHQLLKK